MTKTLIVPGLDGSPAPHWQDWWARTDPTAMLLDMGDMTRPVREVWEATLAVHIMTHPDSILVGHSLGSVTIAHLLARWPGLRVRAALLVAPADTQSSDRIRRFGALPRERFDVPTLVVASRNDPWMSFDTSRSLADNWGADLHDLGHAGHVNTASGFGPWPAGKRMRDALLAQTRRPSVLRRMFGRPAPQPARLRLTA
ncbi:alpha/beta hydrolase (plasmid) [Paracoccus liaowanqingii]|uniref:Alpha/beta hydrolase n=1 Tax=Paracoccus liaowanqingii TaxID=2560053 RepID=A0A4Y5SUE2_9RHOB|nr:alpha/beta hydrolase [Paracoccus liaowanqingii]QDA36508.1 alpha/beta hydrolase [Paracoccus liaowanqingii]